MEHENIEQELTLKDGRIMYKTHNGFRSWLKKDKDSQPQMITDAYYNSSKKHATNLKDSKVKRINKIPKHLR